MKISEVTDSPALEQQLGILLTVLSFLRNRAHDKNLVPRISTDAIIQMVKNAGQVTFDFDAFNSAYKTSDAVKNIVKEFDKDKTTLLPFGGEVDSTSDEEETPEDKEVRDSQKTVHTMAQRARKNRPQS